MIKTFTIYAAGNYRREVTGTAEQAIQKASNYVSLSPLQACNKARELAVYGRCMYGYGLDTVCIEVKG